MVDDAKGIARLETEHIRKVFANEARDFTTWLEEHIDALADRLGIELKVVQREKAVGDFKMDLWCEDGDGNAVIVENQLDATNHDHLGKLLTYLVNLGAVTAVWVTSEPRLEHQKVIDWLNESTPADVSFYLVKAEAARIGDSPYAPLFTIASAPDTQMKQTGHEKKERAERHLQQFEFWKSLLERSKARTQLFAGVAPRHQYWISASTGRPRTLFAYVIYAKAAQVELYIDLGTGEKNKAMFDALFQEKDMIEQEFGGQLNWQRLDDKRACRIAMPVGNSGWEDASNWPSLQDAMIDAMVRLDSVFRPRIAKIKV